MTRTHLAPPMKFQRSHRGNQRPWWVAPKAHGWYYAESPTGVGYTIYQGEFAWYVKADGVHVARCQSFKAAKAAANAHLTTTK